MPILLLGHKGMLGSDLKTELETHGQEVLGLDLPEFDITDPVACAGIAVGKFGKVEWVVNCAAYTAVDKAESEPDLALKVNALGPGYVARACAILGARMLHVSTDFVFDGARTTPYLETDVPNPQGVYARSKYEGELAVRQAGCEALAVRTAWLFGPNGSSFPRTMIRAWLAEKPLRVVADQIGSPTSTVELARVLSELMAKNPSPGVYHAAGPEAMSWHAFATQAIAYYRDEVLHSDRDIEIEPISSSDWPTPAPRPKFSVLGDTKLAELEISPMRPLSESLSKFVSRLSLP